MPPPRVSLLDETVVVRQINESAITKDQESFSLAELSLEEQLLHRMDTQDQ